LLETLKISSCMDRPALQFRDSNSNGTTVEPIFPSCSSNDANLPESKLTHYSIRTWLGSIEENSRRLARSGLPLLRSMALSERLDLNSASLRLAKFAHFHRASELFLGRRVTPHPVVRAAMTYAPPDEALCSNLATVGGNDVAGATWGTLVYEGLFGACDRRNRGEFFTPPTIARVMADWTLRTGHERVLDPCTGPGNLLFAAYKRLLSLGSQKPSKQLCGVELSLLAPTFASLALAPASDRPRINQVDFLNAFRSRRGSFDAIIANPPYSRHQSLDLKYKEEISELTDRIFGVRTSRRAGIHLHFFARSLDLLRDGGRLAFLIPRELLDGQYGASLRAHILRSSRLRALVLLDSAVSAFDGVLTTSAITLLERGTPDRRFVRVVSVRTLPSAQDLMAAITCTRQQNYSWGESLNAEYHGLENTTQWSTVVAANDLSIGKDNLVPLGELATSKRGVATGANRFFLISSAEASAAGLRARSLRPAIGRARLSKGLQITRRDFERWVKNGERVWLVDIRGTPSRKELQYLQTGIRLRLCDRFLCRSRKRWYTMERREPPPILVTYMARTEPRFLRNTARLVPLNVFHGLYPKSLNRAQISRLLKCLNADDFRSRLTRAARSYSGGLLKIEPRELLAIPITDVRCD
jgi:adenine-specific DNA-methyltransferase